MNSEMFVSESWVGKGVAVWEPWEGAGGGNVEQIAIDVNVNYSLTSYRNED